MYDVSEEEEIQRYCRHNNYVLQQAPRASLCTARDGCLKLALVNTIKYIRHTEQSPIIASLEEDKNAIFNSLVRVIGQKKIT